ncbi:MAG: DUF3465 domain-containing protein [Gammaproteobacteria bacterium]
MLAKIVRGVLIVVAAFVALWFQQQEEGGAAQNGTSLPTAVADDADRIVAAFEAQQGDLWVETSGVVDRLLKDDREGSQHQKFIVRLGNGHSVLIAHNIDLAPRVPVSTGDRVRFRGEYEWNNRGGVVHWTHHDPRGRKEGGWIALADEVYK